AKELEEAKKAAKKALDDAGIESDYFDKYIDSAKTIEGLETYVKEVIASHEATEAEEAAKELEEAKKAAKKALDDAGIESNYFDKYIDSAKTIEGLEAYVKEVIASHEATKVEEPSKKDDNKPSKKDDNKPSKKDDNKSSKEDDKKPSKEDDKKPSKEDDKKPSKEDDKKPSKEDDKKPSKEDDNKPSKKDDNKPSKKDDNKPSKKDDNKSSKEDEKDPAKEEKANKTETKKVAVAKETKSNNPKTGVAGSIAVASILASASAGLVATKKRK
ncbi:MAG: hypothetical protein MR512_05340, partial [Anaerococcus sp.]|nr:hypothetical protein [Anaerococcus sp.]